MNKLGTFATSVCLLCCSLFPRIVHCNIYNGSLNFARSPDLVIEKQDVQISLHEVKVSYQLHNNSNEDINETLVFAAPVVLKINDQDIKLKSYHRAIAKDGRDVTNILKGLNLAIDPIGAMHSIDASVNRENIRTKLFALNLLDKDETPQWLVKIFYYWPQKFPASTTTNVSHNYKPQVETKIAELDNSSILHMPVKMLKKLYNLTVNWTTQNPISAKSLQEQLEKYFPTIKQYCASLDDYQTILGHTQTDNELHSLATKELNYNYLSDDLWSAPIERFSVKINATDEMYPLLCWNGNFKRERDNSLSFEAKNYIPLQNIKILFVEKS